MFFVLCSAASSSDKQPPEAVINAAIGFLHDIQIKGSSIDNGTLMKAQAYLLELKRGNNINVGHIDSHNFIVNYNIIGDTTWIIEKYDADGYFAMECFSKSKNKQPYPLINNVCKRLITLQ